MIFFLLSGSLIEKLQLKEWKTILALPVAQGNYTCPTYCLSPDGVTFF